MNKSQFSFEAFSFAPTPISQQAYIFLFDEWTKSASGLEQFLRTNSTCATRPQALIQADAALETEREVFANGLFYPGFVPVSYVDFSEPIKLEMASGGSDGSIFAYEYEDKDDYDTWTLIGYVSKGDASLPDVFSFSFTPESEKKYLALAGSLGSGQTITLTRAFSISPSYLENFPECNFEGFGSDKPIGFVQNGDPEQRQYMWQMTKNSLTILANNSLPVQALYFRG